jgi:ech hydrogenase subunit C
MGLIAKSRVKSPWVVHFDCNSCNGCDIEILACLTPMYDVERFGIINVGNPKHADVLVVSGSVNHRNIRALRNIYEGMPLPKVVVAVGACGCTGGPFADAYNVLGGVDKVIPVDTYVPGCCPKPEAIMDGILLAASKLNDPEAQRRHQEFQRQMDPNPPEVQEVPRVHIRHRGVGL